MKKIIVALAAASLLLASCSGDMCKCTTTKGENKVVTKVARPEDGKCSDLETNGKGEIGGISIDTGVKVNCVTISDSAE